MREAQGSGARSSPGDVSRNRFADGTAVITGGAAGIGAGFARHLAHIGMNAVIADIDIARATDLADELTSRGMRAVAHKVDVSDPEALDSLAQSVYAMFGSVELLINNAGIGSIGRTIWEITAPRWRSLMSTNLDGIFYSVRAFLPRMIALGKPAVVANVSSLGGLSTSPFQAPYNISKHAVVALTECLQQEVVVSGASIQVSVVLPFRVKTNILLGARESLSNNAQASALFDAMWAANEAHGMDAVDAAEHMVASIAKGNFWVFSDDAAGKLYMDARAAHLGGQTLPEGPRLSTELARGTTSTVSYTGG